MKFTEITTPYVKRKMIVYGSEFNKLVRHNISVRQVEGSVYMSDVEYPSNCNYPHCDLYFYLPTVGLGIMICGVSADDDVQRYVTAAEKQGMDSAENFISYLDGLVERSAYIPTNMIELASCIKPDNAERYRTSNAEILRLRREKEAEERAAQDAKDVKYVAEKNREAQVKIDAAVRILQNDGILENAEIEIYRSRYDISVYSVINHLMRQYGVKVPLRTQGRINSKLVTATIENGACEYVQYRTSKNGKCSQVIFGYLTELAQATRKEAAHESVA